MDRKCETCGSIDFGKWGTLGLVGYSLIVGLLGYALFQTFRLYVHLTPYMLILGVVLLLPVYVISFREQLKEKRISMIVDSSLTFEEAHKKAVDKEKNNVCPRGKNDKE